MISPYGKNPPSTVYHLCRLGLYFMCVFMLDVMIGFFLVIKEEDVMSQEKSPQNTT